MCNRVKLRQTFPSLAGIHAPNVAFDKTLGPCFPALACLCRTRGTHRQAHSTNGGLIYFCGAVFGARQQAVRFFRREACFPEICPTRGSQFTRRLFVSSGKPELMKTKAIFRTPKTEFRRHYIDDPDRFSSGSELSAYFGLMPALDSSAGRGRLGHITKQIPPAARRLLVESSWIAIRRSSTIRSKFKRTRKGDPDRNKIAI